MRWVGNWAIQKRDKRKKKAVKPRKNTKVEEAGFAVAKS